MSRHPKPAIPSNIQNLIRANDLHAEAVYQAKLNLAKANETKFREQHNSIIRNAEVRRNIRKSNDEARLARNDIIVDRRQRIAELYEEDQKRWEAELLAKGYTIYHE